MPRRLPDQIVASGSEDGKLDHRLAHGNFLDVPVAHHHVDQHPIGFHRRLL
jgi:hypothetical protein